MTVWKACRSLFRRGELYCVCSGSEDARVGGTGFPACRCLFEFLVSCHHFAIGKKTLGGTRLKKIGTNLDTGFQPVNPWQSAERSESRRQLPHLQTPQATYFVTFRCRDGLLLPEEARETVLSAVRYWDEVKIAVDGVVVMPNHVHIILRVLEDRTLSAVLQSIKGFSAREVNRLLGRKGALWLDESFDHIIRHEQEWMEKIAYIRNNPVKAGLVAAWPEYHWLWIKG